MRTGETTPQGRGEGHSGDTNPEGLAVPTPDKRVRQRHALRWFSELVDWRNELTRRGAAMPLSAPYEFGSSKRLHGNARSWFKRAADALAA